MHIAIEGMDGVGKTTVCKELGNRTGFEFIDKPLRFLFSENASYTEYFRIRDYVNSRKDRKFTSWFYGLGSLYMYDYFRGKNIITDRHLLSNYAWSGTNDSMPVFDALLEVMGVPDFTVILYADKGAITERLKQRDGQDPDLKKIRSSEEIYDKMEYFAKYARMSYMKVNTSKLSPCSVCEIIEKKLISEGIINE